MKKILIVYFSRTGKTEKMAQYIAEGVRMSGCAVEMSSVSKIASDAEIIGYDGYIFGCPTYHKDMTSNMKQFLFLAERANLVGKIGGAFGSHTHSGEAAPMIYDTMQHVFKMDITTLGPLNLEEAKIDTDEGLKACQQYGRTVGEMLAG
ncbi:MAG: flavodoxin domain-containing protein [Desulfofustis sp.]|jgi:flavodoxin|nr:flavodoxin domain-containing protein [Desulfofustis sp.]